MTDNIEKMSDDNCGTEHGVVTKEEIRTKKPSMYQVVLLNDDYTPMDFVVDILEKYFQKRHHEATKIMLNIHNEGKGIAGVYTYEIAETKVMQVMEEAKNQEYPLQCTMEKVQ